MNYLVFAQTADTADLAVRLVAQARAHFPGLQVTVEGRIVRAEREGRSVALDVTPRVATDDDRERARAAEVRGRAGGMGDLAARCPRVWVLSVASPGPGWLVLELAALLAFVALGPILPPDGSTLLGVKSARERARALREAS